uniref:Uncharacterized protein n=1 Tax=Eutreptiella gymnastica TaxID=73025 RepID=A0A7S1HVC7_9EUGL|mmetsp:Transcript_108309/g.187076  ORF Transcript_108309/g.187076 Transcript_108309/m.187076 type:complete len:181 (+) Transcript_108309:450-992(+)
MFPWLGGTGSPTSNLQEKKDQYPVLPPVNTLSQGQGQGTDSSAKKGTNQPNRPKLKPMFTKPPNARLLVPVSSKEGQAISHKGLFGCVQIWYCSFVCVVGEAAVILYAVSDATRRGSEVEKGELLLSPGHPLRQGTADWLFGASRSPSWAQSLPSWPDWGLSLLLALGAWLSEQDHPYPV